MGKGNWGRLGGVCVCVCVEARRGAGGEGGYVGTSPCLGAITFWVGEGRWMLNLCSCHKGVGGWDCFMTALSCSTGAVQMIVTGS